MLSISSRSGSEVQKLHVHGQCKLKQLVPDSLRETGLRTILYNLENSCSAYSTYDSTVEVAMAVP